MSTETRRRPTSVDAVIAAVRRELDGTVEHDALADAARTVVAVERERLAGGADPVSVDDLAADVATRLAALGDVPLETVLNATGVIVHTNLGRSPLSDSVIETIATIGANYNNLEFDLASGNRGSRAAYLEHNLALLCGAEAATVTNNCAAALVLILRHFCTTKKPEIIISRGELVQIGGGSPEAGRRIARLVRSVSRKPVTHLIVTHWHGDHTLGLSGVLESWSDARIIASERTRAALFGSPTYRYAKGGPNPDRTIAFLQVLE